MKGRNCVFKYRLHFSVKSVMISKVIQIESLGAIER